MTTSLIMEELNKLSLTGRIIVIETTLQTIRNDHQHNLQQAVDALQDDYKTNKELTVFTQPDTEAFYEAR